MTDITKLLELKDKIVAIEATMSNLQNEKSNLLKKLKATCTHPTTKLHANHYEGGYDYVSERVVHTICTICNTTLNSTRTPGTYA